MNEIYLRSYREITPTLYPRGVARRSGTRYHSQWGADIGGGMVNWKSSKMTEPKRSTHALGVDKLQGAHADTIGTVGRSVDTTELARPTRPTSLTHYWTYFVCGSRIHRTERGCEPMRGGHLASEAYASRPPEASRRLGIIRRWGASHSARVAIDLPTQAATSDRDGVVRQLSAARRARPPPHRLHRKRTPRCDCRRPSCREPPTSACKRTAAHQPRQTS